MIQYFTRLPNVFPRIIALGTITLMGLMSAGCEDSSRVDGVAWNKAEAPADPTAPGASAEAPADPTAPGVSGDAVPYGAFNWPYGGFNGRGASHSGVTISGLRFVGNTLFFNYDTDLSAWGMSHGDAGGALACLFVKNTSGQWVGGKFDWISSSRTSRELKHCLEGYNGWSMAGIPNPCEAAFVIVCPKGGRRSNVLSGTWRR